MGYSCSGPHTSKAMETLVDCLYCSWKKKSICIAHTTSCFLAGNKGIDMLFFFFKQFTVKSTYFSMVNNSETWVEAEGE